MAKIEVVLPTGDIITTNSNNKTAEEIGKAIINRQQIAANYCVSKGWPTDPTQLSFDQILEIREQKEWINAGK